MKCPNCEEEIGDINNFCPNCGHKFWPVPKSDLVVICSGLLEDGSKCLRELKPNNKFCPECGNKVDRQLFSSLEQPLSLPTSQGDTTFGGGNGLSSPSLTAPAVPENKITVVETALGSSVPDTSIETNIKEDSEQTRRAEIQPDDNDKDDTKASNERQSETLTTEVTETSKGNLKIFPNTNTGNHTSEEKGSEKNSSEEVLPQENEAAGVDETDSKTVEERKIENLPTEGTGKSNSTSSGNLNIFVEKRSDFEIQTSDKSKQLVSSELEKLAATETLGSAIDDSTKKGNLKLINESEVSPEKVNREEEKSEIDHTSTNSGKPAAENGNSDNNNQDIHEIEHNRISLKESAEIETGNERDENKRQVDIDVQSQNVGKKQTNKDNTDKRLSNSGNFGDKKLTEKYREEKEIDTTQNTNFSNKQDKELVDQNDSTQNPNNSFEPVFGGAQKWKKDENANMSNETRPTGAVSLFDTPVVRTTTEQNPDDQGECSSAEEQESETESSKVESQGMEDGKTLNKNQRKNLRRKQRRQEKANVQNEQNKNEVGGAHAQQPGSYAAAVVKTQKTDTSSRSKSERTVLVHFHVLVGDEFKNDSQDRQLVLRSDFHSGWQENIVLTQKRQLQNVQEMEISLNIPRHRITYGGKIHYKYCILSKGKNTESKHEYELYRVGQKTGPGANRTLILPTKWLNRDVWHQYDGYFEKDLGFFKSTVNIFIPWNEWKKHAKLAVKVFTASICEEMISKFSIQEGLDLLEILMTGMRKVYYVENGYWKEDYEFKKDAGVCIVKALLDCLEKDQAQRHGNETLEQKERRLVTALACVYTAKSLSVDIQVKSAQFLCEALEIIPDKEANECMEICLAERFFRNRGELKNSFVYVVESMMVKSKNPSWLYLMPWIHFLSKKVKPFEKFEVDLGHDKIEPAWWGISQLKKGTVDQFKNHHGSWNIPVDKMIGKLLPLYEMDFLLPRTVMSVIELKSLNLAIRTQKIPVEICIATLIWYLRTTRPHPYNGYEYGYTTSDENNVLTCANALLEQLQAFFDSDKENKARWKMAFKFSASLLDESLITDRSVTMYTCAQIALHSLAIHHKLENSDGFILEIKQMVVMVCRWLKWRITKWNFYMEENLRVWDNTLAPVQLQSESVRDLWNKEITSALLTTLSHETVSDRWTTSNLIKLFCEKTDSFHQATQDCLSEVAFKTISQGYDMDYTGLNSAGHKRFGELLSGMFNTEWSKNVEKGGSMNISDEEKILNHVLHWKPFLHFLRIYEKYIGLPSKTSSKDVRKDKDQAKVKLFDESCKIRMVQAVSVIEKVVGSLLNGSITIETLDLIQVQENRFDEIAEHVVSEKKQKKEFFQKAMSVRQREMNAFYEQASYMTSLTSLCQHLQNVDRKAVDIVLDKQTNMKKHCVKEFCDPAPIDSEADVKTFKPKLCAFDVSPRVIQILPQLHCCYQSNTFVKLWQESEVGNQPLTLDAVIQLVWEPVKQRWDELANSIKTGEITFQLMEKFIGQVHRENNDGMQMELKAMEITPKVASERLEQLDQYRHLETCVFGAKVILEFSKEYKLKGDFKDIEAIASYGQKDLEMRYFDTNLMKTCKFLGDFSKEKANCLHTFVTCEPLVNWLKKSMSETGLKELKVFVDLAFMSAGDEPMNVKRVQCLHSAVTGYAPLIFDLKPKSGYKELLDKCSLVWKEFSANPDLPKQLKDTNRHLEWLKDIKKAHGSVEVTSLVQAEAINACGIYTVGRGAWRNKPDMKEKGGLMPVLQLTVSEVEGKRQLRNYSFSQLQDLQSRLMLVAGKAEKGNEGVENFTMVFDSIIRLSKVYMQLCSAGCVLFKEWTARFLCDPKRPVCAILEFGESEDTPNMKGRRNEHEDLKEVIPQLANFMEECYEAWLAYIKDKRSEYLHLNFFTTDQLVILQRELVKCGTEEEPSYRVYPLLSAVKQDCTPDDLINAMKEAKASLDRTETVEDEDSEMSDQDEQESESETEENLKQTFIQEIIDAGYDQTLALRALEHVTPDNVDEGIIWCINNADAEEVTDSDPEEEDAVLEREYLEETGAATSTPRFTGWNLGADDSIQSLITRQIQSIHRDQSGDGFKPLHAALKLLWEDFLGSITSNVKDYLSLEHLGLILRCLASTNKFCVQRTLPPGYVEGVPNLLICPSADVLPMVLSLYMMTKDQPLPLPDEVLLCTSHTTVDEVDIFWKRALFGDATKLHCLANVDLLGYDVSDAAERNLEEYQQSGNYNAKFKLVVICGSDHENHSKIVSSLDKCRRPALPINLPRVRERLTEKLQVLEPVSGINPASYLDFKQSCVRLVKSWRSGVGKTLYKNRKITEQTKLNPRQANGGCVSIPLQEKSVDLHYVMNRLLEHTPTPGRRIPIIFHIDIAHEVQHGIDYLLFNLLVLGCVMDRTGYVWRKSPADLYLIETMPLMIQANTQKAGDMQYVHKMLDILPDMTCRSPLESLNIYANREPADLKQSDQLFDQEQFMSSVFQRPFQYLWRHDLRKPLENINPYLAEGDAQTCLHTLLRHCGIPDPSWAELHHFVWFLNTQLRDYESNDFVSVAAAEDLPGFSTFVLRFLINMSRDFSTRSLNMSEQSPGVQYERQQHEGGGDLDLYQMRRTWESSPHPYLFINQDSTFTFLGFNIDRATGNMIDQQTGQVLEQGIMTQNLYDSLVRHSVPIQENFDALQRHEKILKLCKVMGVDMPHDPDDTYELTTDNVKKIMAIYMRFRCDIPVIIMGETGCGKTRLVKFMCSLQMPPGLEVTNMVLMKVHGGTTNADIKRKVQMAERIAQKNLEAFGNQMFTILFFDEANTTESIGLIKEIMCDKTMEGKKLKLCDNLKMVAACNPYRKHSEDLIKKLEQAGLGYHVDAEDTTDKLGRVPMRRLVYRVQPLPQSLLPLVWDFGQLNTQVEELYIRQMVRRYINGGQLPDIANLVEVVSRILTASQEHMRQQKDECSFVSLRDVDRVLNVMSWFYRQSGENRTLFDLMDEAGMSDSEGEESYDEEEGELREIGQGSDISDITRSLVLALGVCYHACLRDRQQYRQSVARFFQPPCALPRGAEQIEEEIVRCQEVFLDQVELEKNIARNMALKENVFMMVVCIELRIPLFLVGKPGSSKSLAKTIVSDAMQGNASREELFKEFKQATMVSFQCSPLSTPDGIVGTFRQCAQFQKDKDLSSFVSIVVLDEVGLAEDSPRMPLKTLHPLLEDGCQGDETPEKHLKVAFIGISNWALDPAKMNRGILVQREVPDLEELENSAKGICTTDDNKHVLQRIKPLIKPMATSYLEIFKKASKERREFYGLRDFYSLVKMVYAFTERSRRDPTWHEMLHAILRNFGGLDQIEPVSSFKEHLSKVKHLDEQQRLSDPDCSPKGLIEACLFDTNQLKSESRYLLLLTENYGALTILQQEILASDIRPITIFGSSFRRDQEYTQVCRNINKIKVCMETGNTVVLLNLENLYESLYDALNQYYVYFGGERYVDLGLGTHRVKCPVHRSFRLIVVAEKQTVYDKFPTPLINRLEKHFLSLSNMLTPEQQVLVKRLEEWAEHFVKQTGPVQPFRRSEKVQTSKVGDVFMGYHDDTCSAVVIHVWPQNFKRTDDRAMDAILHKAKVMLLWCATPDAVVRLNKSNLRIQEQAEMKKIYQQQQSHESISQYLHQTIVTEGRKQLFAQVTTHSKLLPSSQRAELSEATGIYTSHIMLLDTLSSFDTEQQFSIKIQQFLKQRDDQVSLLIVQCDSGDRNGNLVACARYCVMDEFESMREELQAPVHVVFIVQLPRIAGGCFTGFQCGVWHSVHIDDLRVADADLPTVQDMEGKSVAALLESAVGTREPRNTGDRTPSQTEEMECSPACTPTDQEPGILPKGEAVPSISHHDSSLLDIQDIRISFERVGDRLQGDDRVLRKNISVRPLVMSCVQAALSMVKDKDENTGRTTDRVPLVLKLFHHSGQQQFFQGVCHLIAALLKEKENTTSVFMANEWLTEEAAKYENINKAGTFRRSCLQTLESKIAPILAGIIAYLDANENLDILQEDQLSWKQEFWLTMLNTPKAIPLKYADLQSPKRQSDLPEVVVMTRGCEGQTFKGQMPFSWLIFAQLDEVINTTPSRESEEESNLKERVDLYVGVLMESIIGNLLGNLQDSDEVVHSYLADFVYMVYKVLNPQEHTLVCQSVIFLANQMVEQIEGGSLLHILVCVHLAHGSLAPRLVYFHQMNCDWPECSSVIMQLKEEKPDHYMFREEEFTFSTLCLLIEQLNPGKNMLNQPESRSQWLQKVHQYRQVIEKVISLHREDPDKYGVHSHVTVRRASCLWSRVVVVKLFLEHVCMADDKDAITVKHCMPLWTLLGEEANLKELKSLESLEKFLKSCNQRAIREFLGQEEKCCLCEVVLEGPPIVLPCGDILCDTCLHDIKALGDIVCPKCKRQVQRTWNPERQAENKKANGKMKDYQKRCNSFFMDVVSQLCFAENTPPTEAVIEKLLKYVLYSKPAQGDRPRIHMTKEMSIFDTGIDPTPVFRSFLLQLLMRTSRETVTDNLEHYLREADRFLSRDLAGKDSHYISLGQLIIQCFEDILLKETVSSEVDDIVAASEYLREARHTIDTDELNVDKLCGLAETRIGLAIAAKYIAKIVAEPQVRVHQNVRRVIEAAHVLCTELKTNMPRTYLVKFLCRRYGIDTYQAVCKSEQHYLHWIAMRDLDRQERIECADRNVVCGDSYTQLREALTKVIIGEDVQHLQETIQGMERNQGHIEVLLQLAIHREITCASLYPPEKQRVTDKVIQTVQDFIQACDVITNKAMVQQLLHNQVGGQHLVIVEREPLRLQGVQCLLQHFLSVISTLKGERTLLHPLIQLMKAPQTCQNAYLPTMPQDDMEEVREAMLAARHTQAGQGENPVFYRCPNGHAYVIGNCGRPAYVGTCKICGSDIGGQGYNLRPGNQLDRGTDETATGHILGRAEARGQGPKPERTLTPIHCACLRLFTHMAMYSGTLANQQAIQTLIKPDIMPAEAPEFLWKHILADFEDIQRGVGKSLDDVLLLMHSIINTIMCTHQPGNNVREDISQLSTKKGRTDWEQQFSLKYLKPVLQDVDANLKENNQKILQDRRLGADPLLCLLYETDTQPAAVHPGLIQDVPSVWRYRTPISIDHLRLEFEAQPSNKKYKVLQHFLKEDHFLRAIRYIPGILKLHRILFSKFLRKLDKEEASTITIGNLLRDDAGTVTRNLIQEFADAWELLREKLKNYVCPTDLGGVIVSKEYCSKSINDDMPIAILLPTTKEMGLCSYALLDFLMRKQNDFLDAYVKAARRSKDSVLKVSPRDVTAAHLISYDPQQDILPLVLANCKYSFEMGKGTKIEYDFEGLEKQLMDRFLFSKSKIDVGRTLQIEQMVFRAEVTNALVFSKLADKIPQECLNAAVKSQISSEFKSLPDLCTSLDNLDITISFLTSVGGDPQQSLNDFMVNTLKMENSLTSQKARQECQFQHAQSLWLLLSFLKSKQIADHNQPRESMFENIETKYHQELPEDALQDFRQYMKNLSVDKLSQLVEVLHEYVVLVVSVRDSTDDEDYVDKATKEMFGWLYGYIENLERPSLDIDMLNGFPQEIRVGHSSHVWIEAYWMLQEKKTGSRH